VFAGLIASAALTGLEAKPASAAMLNTIDAFAYNYYSKVSVQGGPASLRGYGQLQCVTPAVSTGPELGRTTVPALPLGCVPSDQVATASSPSTGCPVGGGASSVVDPDGARAQHGPPVFFGGLKDPTNTKVPPSGPLSSSVSCQPGASSTASTHVTQMPAGSVWTPPGSTNPEPHLGGVGPGPALADALSSTCTATPTGVTGTTAVTGGVVVTSTNSSGDPATTVTVPANPLPNHTVTGTANHYGPNETFKVVYNEQTTNADGSFTVIAQHLYLLGPGHVGEVVVGASTCGPRQLPPTLD